MLKANIKYDGINEQVCQTYSKPKRKTYLDTGSVGKFQTRHCKRFQFENQMGI